jgi:hypothetical protein
MHTGSASERERLLAALAAGDPTSDLGIPSSTVRSWRRRDPEFARRYAEAKEKAAARPTPELPLQPGEWERILARACRSGSVAALMLWRETHPGAGAVAGPSAEQVDQLARLRARHARIEAGQR